MKKMLVILLSVMVFAGLALAQTASPPAAPPVGVVPAAPTGTAMTWANPGNGATVNPPAWAGSVDKLGAHQNGGRGCTGCHAPHSGAAGAGGNAANTFDVPTSTWAQTVDTTEGGNFALWGQDLGPLYGAALSGMYGGYTLPTAAEFETKESEVTGVMMCLSCHDGNIAKGAMMTNRSYEQAMGLLPAGLYGPAAIPTLLGNDTVSAAGNYANDHPVGTSATLGAVRVASHFTYTAAGCGSSSKFDCLKVNAGDTSYLNFVAHYGAPSIISNGHSSPVVLTGAKDAASAFVVCTTCHTPHSMYTTGANADATIAGLSSGTFPTYFFLAAPYNPGSQPANNQASSATQFCRQCHFTGAGGSNEGSGINGVTTAF